jgi:hypothetical protein
VVIIERMEKLSEIKRKTPRSKKIKHQKLEQHGEIREIVGQQFKMKMKTTLAQKKIVL